MEQIATVPIPITPAEGNDLMPSVRSPRIARASIWCLLAASAAMPRLAAGEAAGGDAWSARIRADWLQQEERLGRTAGSPESLEAALERTARLFEDLGSLPEMGEFAVERAKLDELVRRVGRAERLSDEERLALYFQVRGLTRDVALRNPLVAGKPILFLQCRRFICQMLHEYIGYYYNYPGVHGGGIYVLEEPGRSPEVRCLTEGKLPQGAYTTPALSYDGKTIYFAFCPVEERARNPVLNHNHEGLKKDPLGSTGAPYYEPDRGVFSIYAVDSDGTNLRRLTEGSEDDMNPVPLPDGGIVFLSTRRGGFIRCDNAYEPVPAHTLHRMNADGSGIRTLSFHETNEWHPTVLNDGRICYCRWDYVDRSAENFHGLWVCNPDGTNPRIAVGNYTRTINAFYQPMAIPNSNKIAFIAGAHHANVGGAICLFDPSLVALEAETGLDDLRSVEVLTPEICFPEAPGWPDSFFHGPMPLSEDYYLVSFSFQRLPGMGSGMLDDGDTGIYYFDRFGNLELLYQKPGICSMNPIPLAPRPEPPVVADRREAALGDEGTFLVANVNWSHLPMPPDRPIKELRVFQLLPKSRTHRANDPRIGHANQETARMLLGTVPVEQDGSAHFRAPARKPLYFQAVDADGLAVQTMRSEVYLQPGETLTCVGCHEPLHSTPPSTQPLAGLREPSRLKPGPEGTLPMSYPLLVQPILDRNCVSCHDGAEGEGRSPLILTADPAGAFTQSYASLRAYVRWFEYGRDTLYENVSIPGRLPAAASRLLSILEDDIHADAVRLTDQERRNLYIWLDANVPFYGSYEDGPRRAQLEGKAIDPPELQ